LFSRGKWGIHPETHKTATADRPIESMKLPEKVIIPIRQHIGAPCEPVVKKGDLVKTGQLIAVGNAAVSSNTHASVSGTVTEIAVKPHPICGEDMAIVIESDGADQWEENIPTNRDWQAMTNEEILSIIKNAGIVGMGGAAFPTYVKLNPPKDKQIDTLIINAAECEPFLTADHRVMLEYAQSVVSGIKIMKKILGVQNIIVGVEDNKMDAVKVMREAFGDLAQVIPMKTQYPQGAEKMIIKTLLQRSVSSGQLPMDVGVVVQNVGTAAAVADAVIKGIPLVERIVTVSGSMIKEPKNLKVRIGTSFADVIAACGGFEGTPGKVIMGGPMMGIAEYTVDVPVIKGTSGILAISVKEAKKMEESPCIHCGKCVSVCPMGLNPSMLSILAEKEIIDEARDEYNIVDCMECGCCSFVCPAKRHIVHHIKYTKKLLADKAAREKGATK